MVAISAFITSLATSFGIFSILVILYIYLVRKPGNSVIYYPALLLRGKDPPKLSKFRGTWAWAWEAFRAKESDIIDAAGLDAAIYIIMLGTALKIIVFSGAFLVPVLIPLAITDDQIKILNADPDTATNTSPLDKLSMSNVKPKSARIWAYLGGVYWLSFVTYWVLLKTYKHVVDLRAAHQSAWKAKPEQFACLVRDIPKLGKEQTRSEQVDHFFREVHPDTYEKSLIVTKLNKASKLWTKLETAKSKLAHAEAVYDQSVGKKHPDGVRPQHKLGKFGLYGKKVDSIDYWNEQIKELPPKLQEQQELSKADKQQAAAVIFFNSRRAAAEASQEKHSPYADRWGVCRAPEPRALLWENMPVGFYSRMIREAVVYVAVFFTVVFYMIPIGFISGVSNLDNITKYLPFLKSVVKIGPLKAILEAYLPQLALIIFLMFLPKLCMIFSKSEGIVSKAHCERAASGKYFYFVVFNGFLGITLFGTVFQSSKGLKELTQAGNFSFSKVVTLFGSSLPGQATFYITYVALQFFVGYGLELSRLVPLIIYHLKRKYLCKTDAEVEDAWAPGAFSYLSTVPNDLLILVVTMAYAAIAPLILPFAFVYFALGWLIERNQALKVYVPDYESAGRFWPHMHSRFLVALFVSQITALGYFGVKKFAFTFFLLPLLFITIMFAILTHKVFYSSFQFISVSAASQDVKEVPTLASVVDAYTPTCLLPALAMPEHDKMDDSKYEDAESQLPSRSSSGIASPADHPQT